MACVADAVACASFSALTGFVSSVGLHILFGQPLYTLSRGVVVSVP